MGHGLQLLRRPAESGVKGRLLRACGALRTIGPARKIIGRVMPEAAARAADGGRARVDGLLAAGAESAASRGGKRRHLGKGLGREEQRTATSQPQFVAIQKRDESEAGGGAVDQ